MGPRFAFTFATLLLLCGPARAQEDEVNLPTVFDAQQASFEQPSYVKSELAEQIKRSLDFDCEGVSFDTTLPDFLKLHPDASKSVEDGETVYTLHLKKTFSTVKYYFNGDALSLVVTVYGDRAQGGSYYSLRKQIVSAMGRPRIEEREYCRWNKPDCFIVLRNISNRSCVAIGRTSERTDTR